MRLLDGFLSLAWRIMGGTGKGYKREKLNQPGARNQAGTKIAREAAAGMITKRNGRRL